MSVTEVRPADRPRGPGFVFVDLPWRDRAACRTEGPGLFFGPAEESPAARTVREDAARRVCGCCEVVEECRRFGREHREFGVWGGETEHERAQAGYAPRMAWGVTAKIREGLARPAPRG